MKAWIGMSGNSRVLVDSKTAKVGNRRENYVFWTAT